MDALRTGLKTLGNVLTSGALDKGGSWGGVECKAAVPYETHVFETIMWLGVCCIVFLLFKPVTKMKEVNKKVKAALVLSSISGRQRSLELLLGAIHIAMYIQLIVYKSNILSLINLIQPCHVILLFQGIALLSDGVVAVDITLLMLPALTGTLLAMLFPDTSGLDQYLETESYWIQHYLIQLVPVYLLSRRNFLALSQASGTTTACGLLLLLFLHFSLYEIVDWITMVNVEFMLCPSGAMTQVFSLLPAWVLQPSYRSTLTLAVLVIGCCISFTYIGIANVVKLLTSKEKHLKSV